MAYLISNFENVLQDIQGKYISLSDDEVKKNVAIMNDVIGKMLGEMKKDYIFAALYSRVFYAGSYFDGLKVRSPEEFDIDFLLKVPTAGNATLVETNEPGYLSLRFMAPSQLSENFKQTTMDDQYYFSTKKVRAWMKSVFINALNRISQNGIIRGPNYRVHVETSESGPAMTLILEGKNLKIDIDFVPCFELNNWPTHMGYRANPVPGKNSFYIVPKSPKNRNLNERYWRLSFQEQERELITGKQTLKPTLKLLKLLRDAQQHESIASYYIKTIFLLENEKHSSTFWNGTMTDMFFIMLDKYIQYIEVGNIPYFWNRRNNLLSNVSYATRENMARRLRNIQADVKNNYRSNPGIIKRYLDV